MQIRGLSLLTFPSNIFPRDSVEVLESETLKMKDRCLHLEGDVLEKGLKLHQQDVVRVQSSFVLAVHTGGVRRL